MNACPFRFVLTLLVISPVLSFSLLGQLPDYVPTDGLVAWYPFDGDGQDDSGNGLNGQVMGATGAPDRFQMTNGALHFDGQNDFVTVQNNDAFGDMASSFAVSIWIENVTWQEPNWLYYMSKADWYGQPPFSGSFVIRAGADGGGDFGYSGTIQTTQGNANVGAPDPLYAGWEHIVYQFDGQNIMIYRNGVLASSAMTSGGEMVSNEVDLTIGAANNGQTHHALATLDDVGIWSRSLSGEEIQNLYLSTSPVLGCTNTVACNFDPAAESDDGSCHFNCQFCLNGTVWDESAGGCIGNGSGDINNDGCVQLGDLLDLLGDYGSCESDETAWQCGDPLEYQGYDYLTVQIGEQCWFAENLRSENYNNGDAIAADLTDSEWTSTSEGASSLYNADQVYGRLYNWYAVSDSRNVCPTGWHVSLDNDWNVMINLYGGEDLAGEFLKMSSGWACEGNGTNTSGFSGLPGGYRHGNNGSFQQVLEYGYWWSPSTTGTDSIGRSLNGCFDSGVDRGPHIQRHGFSVRCVKDAE